MSAGEARGLVAAKKAKERRRLEKKEREGEREREGEGGKERGKERERERERERNDAKRIARRENDLRILSLYSEKTEGTPLRSTSIFAKVFITTRSRKQSGSKHRPIEDRGWKGR